MISEVMDIKEEVLRVEENWAKEKRAVNCPLRKKNRQESR
jgi:hypothetical protein